MESGPGSRKGGAEMGRTTSTTALCIVLAMSAWLGSGNRCLAAAPTEGASAVPAGEPAPNAQSAAAEVVPRENLGRRITAAQWKAAAESFKKALKARRSEGVTGPLAPTLLTGPNGYYIPDYFTTPNWANSPPLQKFVDPLPNLYISGLSPAPPPGTEYIPVGVPDQSSYPGSDYYEIELGQFTQKMHSSLPPTTLRGYRQTNTTDPYVNQFRYLGPMIIAQKGRPVRIKFTNNLPGGQYFLPVDGTVMGSGDYMIDYNPQTKAPMSLTSGTFSQSRATLHLHGGLTPWISDGSPHQWTAAASENTPYDKGTGVAYVPDMWFDASGNTITACAGQTTCSVPGATNNPGPGSLTFYYTNDQSARLLFYHDHAMGITRLNVYAGEAAGYLIEDPIEHALINGSDPGTPLTFTPGTIPAEEIPLVIQDKTFVDGNPASPTYVLNTDPTWAWGTQPGTPIGTPVTGDLWWPHVYMPAENPYNPDMSGINPMGRWMYGPWFFPPTPLCGSSVDAVVPYCITNGVVPNEYYDPNCVLNPTVLCQPPERPGTPNPSWGAEAFLDTMLVNGAAYPKLALPAAKPYRFRILNASHDRFLNLQLYRASAIVSGVTVTNGGSGYTESPLVTMTGVGTGATATAVVDLDPTSSTYGQVTAVTMDTVGSGYTSAPLVSIAPPASGTQAMAFATVYTALTEVGMVPAVTTPGFPAKWPKDGREGGVPDPATRGPALIQIGTDSGFLAAPVMLPNEPVNWNMDPTMFNFGNVLQQNQGGGTLFVAPAERADVIVDFSKYAGQTLILYNDAPTAFPALDPHYDYYTCSPDRRAMGGMDTLPPGLGPNIRTIMQITVPGSGGTAPPDDYNPAMLAALQAAFSPSPRQAGVFQADQAPIAVGQTAYNGAYNTIFPATYPNWGVSRISDSALSFQQVDGTIVSNLLMERKAIHDEMGAAFDNYGRMAARLGLEVPFVNAANQNFILQAFIDPPTEVLRSNGVQIWRITHNGVDTHPIHFHLFDVQVVNRVGWDGFIRLPDPNELGWQDTIRVSPLEDTILALRPKRPPAPWPVPNLIRPLNPTMPLLDQSGFSQVDTTTGGPLTPPVGNQMVNFGWEYMVHCHILSHEENDMMRPMVYQVPPEAPGSLSAVTGAGGVDLTFVDQSASETGFTLERADDSSFSTNVVTFPVAGTAPNTAFGGTITYTDTTATAPQYFYRVQAYSNDVYDSYLPTGVQTAMLLSPWSNIATLTPVPIASVSPLTLALGNQLVNTTGVAQTVTLTNAGTAVLDITGIVLTGANAGDFAITSTCGASLAPGISCSISVTFTPSAIGLRSASLDISTSDPAYPTSSVALSGTGISRIAGVAPGSLVFSNQMLYTTSAAQIVTLSNTGTSQLNITSLLIGGTNATEFSRTTSCGAFLPAGATCNINVFFKPMAVGARTATLTITTDDPVNPTLTVSLNGTGAGLSPVGDGKGPTVAATFAKNATTPAQIDVAYDATHCSSPKAVILYGNIGSYAGYAGCAQTNAGNAGAATIDGTTLNNVWFNIVWTSGTTAGHPGFAFDGVHDIARTWKAAGLCGLTADDQTRATCP